MIYINILQKEDKQCVYLTQSIDRLHAMVEMGDLTNFTTITQYELSDDQSTGIINELINRMHSAGFGVMANNIAPPLTQFPIDRLNNIMEFIQKANPDHYIGVKREWATVYSETKDSWKFVPKGERQPNEPKDKPPKPKGTYSYKTKTVRTEGKEPIYYDINEVIKENKALKTEVLTLKSTEQILARKVEDMEFRLIALEKMLAENN